MSDATRRSRRQRIQSLRRERLRILTTVTDTDQADRDKWAEATRLTGLVIEAQGDRAIAEQRAQDAGRARRILNAMNRRYQP